eukprot:8190249-Alexandrium_andersonii.AAC.1
MPLWPGDPGHDRCLPPPGPAVLPPSSLREGVPDQPRLAQMDPRETQQRSRAAVPARLAMP